MNKQLFDCRMFTMIMFAFFASFMSSCGNDNDWQNKSINSLIVGTWETSHSSGQFDTYEFNEDGLGEYTKYVEVYDNPNAYGTSNFVLVFSYILNGDNLILDYGFGYINKFKIEYISDEYLRMYFSNDDIICKRWPGSGSVSVRDYSMDIIGRWIIYDTEQSMQYDINIRADGSYESKTNGIRENGTYLVDKSRVKFTSKNSNSVLDGRIFLITYINKIQGRIYLQTENGISIEGTQEN